LSVQENGLTIMRPQDVIIFRRLRSQPFRQAEAVPPHLAAEGYQHIGEVLTNKERDIISHSQDYTHLVIRENGRIYLRAEAAIEFRRMRAALTGKRRIPPDLLAQGYQNYTELLNTNEQNTVRRAEFSDLTIVANGLRLMRPQDAELFHERKAELQEAKRK